MAKFVAILVIGALLIFWGSTIGYNTAFQQAGVLNVMFAINPAEGTNWYGIEWTAIHCLKFWPFLVFFIGLIGLYRSGVLNKAVIFFGVAVCGLPIAYDLVSLGTYAREIQQFVQTGDVLALGLAGLFFYAAMVANVATEATKPKKELERDPNGPDQCDLISDREIRNHPEFGDPTGIVVCEHHRRDIEYSWECEARGLKKSRPNPLKWFWLKMVGLRGGYAPIIYLQPLESMYSTILIEGGPGTGKTASCIIPTLFNYCAGGLVALDLKPDLFKICREVREQMGREVIAINPYDGEDVWSFNMISHLDPTKPDFLTRVAILMGALVPRVTDAGANAVFADTARFILSAAIIDTIESCPPGEACLDMIKDRIFSQELKQDLFQVIEKGGMAAQMASAALSPPKVDGSSPADIFDSAASNAKTALSPLMNPQFSMMVSGTSNRVFSAMDVIASRVDVFLQFESEVLIEAGGIIALIITAFTGIAKSVGPLKRPLLFLLDETPAAGEPLGNLLLRGCAEQRSLGILYMCTIQDKQQMYKNWRKELADSFYNMVKFKINLSASDDTFEVWDKIWKQSVFQYSINKGESNQISISNTGQGGNTSSGVTRSTISVPVIKRFPGWAEADSMKDGVPRRSPDECIINMNSQPARLGLCRFWRRPEWAALTKGKGPATLAARRENMLAIITTLIGAVVVYLTAKYLNLI